MASNSSLRRANAAKQDEYYTRLSDIEKEMRYYKSFFVDKVVMCNCDDPFESNFFKYFALNFNALKLKRLITTCYATSPIVYTQLSMFGNDTIIGEAPTSRKPYVIDISEIKDLNGDGRIDLKDIQLLLLNRANIKLLKGDGDFRSPECVKYLKQSDVVVTNPPFSLFREYLAQLIEFKKQFIIIGNKNSLHYKEIFPLIQCNKIWLGYRNINEDMWFAVPDNYKHEKIVDGKRVKHIMGCWLTNLDVAKRHEKVILYKTYSPDTYPRYYNYNGIDVSKVSDIPCDYYGDMGVPDTFLQVYNPEQFELIGTSADVPKTMIHKVVGDEIQYIRPDGTIAWRTPYAVSERKAGNSLRIDNNGFPGKLPYSRILIRRRKADESHEDTTL